MNESEGLMSDVLLYQYDIETGEMQSRGDTVHISGYSDEEINQMDLMRIKRMVHPKDRLNTVVIFKNTIKTGKTACIEFRLRKKDGRTIWAELIMIPVFKEQVLVNITGTIQDITYHKNNEEQMEYRQLEDDLLSRWRNEAVSLMEKKSWILSCLEDYINQIPSIDSILMYGTENNITSYYSSSGVSKEFTDQVPYVNSFGDFMAGLTFKSNGFVSIAIDEYPNSELKESLIKENILEIGIFPIRHENTAFGYLIICSKKKDFFKQNKVKLIETFCNETASLLQKTAIIEKYESERNMIKRYEKELRKEKRDLVKKKQGLRRLLQNSEAAVWTTNRQGICIMFEGRALESVGYRQEELMGMSILDIFLKADSGGEELARALDGISTEGELEINDCVFAVSCIPVFDEDGLADGFSGVMLDITRYHEAEERNLFLEQIIKLENIRAEFLTTISHELRTPLNIILSTLQVIKAKEGIDKECDKYLVILEQNANRLLRLINNVIDISKLDTGFYDMKVECEDMISVIEDITLSVAEFIEGKGIHLVFDTDMEEKWMACDREKIERIILNLLSNAIKHTDKGGDISVTIWDKGNSIIFSVKDTGTGIEEDKLSKIFERFVQADNILIRRSEGSGIGLSLVKSLVDIHEGTIHVVSAVGIGSEFIIELPVRECENVIVKKYDHVRKREITEKIKVEFSDIYY